MVIHEPIFYLWSAAGLLAFFYNCFHVWPDWNFSAFVKKKGDTLLKATLLSVVCAYLSPPAIPYLVEQLHLADQVARFPVLAERIVYAAGMAMGYSGGAVFFVVLQWATKLPGIGPWIQQWLDKRKSRKLQASSLKPQAASDKP